MEENVPLENDSLRVENLEDFLKERLEKTVRQETVLPLGNRILAREVPIDAEQKTLGGIYIPIRRTDQDLARADVLWAPAKCRAKNGTEYDCPVKAGQKVCYMKHCGFDIELGGRPHLILDITDLLGVIEIDEGIVW